MDGNEALVRNGWWLSICVALAMLHAVERHNVIVFTPYRKKGANNFASYLFIMFLIFEILLSLKSKRF